MCMTTKDTLYNVMLIVEAIRHGTLVSSLSLLELTAVVRVLAICNRILLGVNNINVMIILRTL